MIDTGFKKIFGPRPTLLPWVSLQSQSVQLGFLQPHLCLLGVPLGPPFDGLNIPIKQMAGRMSLSLLALLFLSDFLL